MGLLGDIGGAIGGSIAGPVGYRDWETLRDWETGFPDTIWALFPSHDTNTL